MALSRASAAREGGGEASVGAVQAGLLSREISGSGCRRCPNKRKATSPAALSRVVGDPARSENLGMHGDLHAREPGGPAITRPEVEAGREGNAEAVIP